MENVPTIVRLLEFPKTVRLTKRGGMYVSRDFESGATILCERAGVAVVRLHLSEDFTFSSGGNEIIRTEEFEDGEHRDVLIPWTLVADDKDRHGKFLLELDVSYQDSPEVHTATAPVRLTYPSVTTKRAAIAVGTIAAAATAVAVASRRRNRKETQRVRAEDIPDEIELAVIDVPQPRRTSAPARKRAAAPAKKKSTSSKKQSSSAKKSPAKKASAKKASAKKASSAKRSTSAKKAGGTRRGSGASRSAPRKGARGSSAGRKSSARRSTRKSR